MRRALVAVLVLGAVVLGGVAGYMLIEGWSLLDSLYMTVITVATVGFREVYPLSATGQIFTIALVLAGVGGITYAVGTIAEFMVEGHLTDLLEGRRMAKKISELRNHYIVVGMGRVGSVVCATLAERGVDFVAIDVSDAAQTAAREHGWLCLTGDATTEEVLENAGARTARGLVTALDTDADNLFVALTAREMNPSLYIVARSSAVASEAKILRSGADRVITPNVISGRRMATMVLDPVVSDYLDVVTHRDEIEYRLEALKVREGSPLAGRTLSEARVREDTGAYILAVASAGRVDSNPPPDLVLVPGTEVVAFGTRSQLEALSGRL